MKIDEIKLLFAYGEWADQRILSACAQVSAEQYAADPGTGVSFGSLRQTLIHHVDAFWSWRVVCQTNKTPGVELTADDLPTVEALKARLETEHEEWRTYLDTLTDERLDGVVGYPLSLWHCLLHLCNHGTQHRAEAAALLTAYGHSPGDVDMVLFLNEHLNLPD